MSSPVLPGAAVAATVSSSASLGFVPVAIHFDLFAILVHLGKSTAVEEVTKVCNDRIHERSKDEPGLSETLAADTLYIMAGLGLVDQESENIFSPNSITEHMVKLPSSQQGALHFTTEVLFAGAFLMRKLKATNFEWPMREADGPVQYAYKLMGYEELSKLHTYSIMAHEGRMDSFNQFMTGKFSKTQKMPDRLQGFGYDLSPAIAANEDSVAMVDIGGGRGELLLEVKEIYPELGPENLVVQEFNPDIGEIPGITLMEWNFKEHSEQPIRGARVYWLQRVLHNLPDLEAIKLLQKVAKAMAAHSRLIILEAVKSVSHAGPHAAMIALFAARERSLSEWKKMAAICGLEVTFEAYPAKGECLIEMRKAER
ncbi:hypothetical protein ASPWEDRAFT_188429 [Aspergillus wentii DTO 134E9]|uniref:O-methyltransferase C-terminal domain-containing protein n=1 Tax=Aspergillus wentii DTO 134E9 TaxID=1073089 RepID=A0A1L9R573_ASPWE|nr:uncharacterized protein ASPWEDRAFT_188429 [Aspergillus wentii DTO 134E9]KAI9927308.1 hypothetical protein MW887_003695 [Aspergillus wentii]OJJ30037.1 hypothetical protein ASPWEDRAFT_188429 [Aspergillus wentii DTO 134E9]